MDYLKKKKKRKKKKESIIDFGNGICLKKKYVTIIEKISEEDIQKMIEYMKYYLKEYRNNRSNNLLRKIK